jgi:hypothetical protein
MKECANLDWLLVRGVRDDLVRVSMVLAWFEEAGSKVSETTA